MWGENHETEGGIWIHKTCLSGSFIAEDHFWIKREHTVRNDLSEKSYYSILLALNGSDEALLRFINVFCTF